MTKDYISDLRSQIEKECRFCNPPEKERILYETDNFYVMVSLGPIIEGYLLIVSKEHISACLNIPDEIWSEFIQLKEKVRKLLSQIYGGCLFYEHGKVGTSLTIGLDHRHCFHSHLHCIPSSINFNQVIGSELVGIKFINISEAHNYVTSHGIERYLLVEDSQTMLYLPQGDLRSQYLRFKLAEAVDKPDSWNWIQNQNWPMINKTIDRLSSHF